MKIFPSFLFVFAVVLMVGYPVAYLTYKQHNFTLVPHDHETYFAMTDDVLHNNVGNPYKYRILTPLLVKALSALPAYDPEITSVLTPAYKKYFFYFTLVDFVFLCLSAALLFFIAISEFAIHPSLALFGSVAFVFSFFNVTMGLVASTDAGACFFIVLLYLLFLRKNVLFFAASAVLGIMQKETTGIVLVLFLLIESIRQRKPQWKWFAALIPAALAYFLLREALPSTGFEHYFSPGSWIHSLMLLFSPATYQRTFLFHTFLGHIPFLTALVIDICLIVRKQAPSFPRGYLLLLPALFMVGMMLDPGNNAGRIAGFSMAWILPYELTIAQTVMARLRLV
jgi:hypothetical protein